MTNFESGRFIAQIFSHLSGKLIQSIYNCTIEPHRKMNEFEMGVLEEIKNMTYKSGMVEDYLDRINRTNLVV